MKNYYEDLTTEQLQEELAACQARKPSGFPGSDKEWWDHREAVEAELERRCNRTKSSDLKSFPQRI